MTADALAKETVTIRSRLAWPRYLPPARLVWISLVALGVYGVHVLGGLGVLPLLVLPLVAVLSDLAFQAARFPKFRFPDPALATGLFLALIFPPVVPLVLAGAATFAAIAIRHALRFRGHPFLNPAAVGVVLGGVLFGLAPAWWVSIGPLGEYLMLGLGALLIIRTPRAWRVPLGFFVAYGLVVAAVHLIVSATVDSTVLVLAVVDPATVFFGLYMVTEPRTGPSDPGLQPVYGAVIGAGAATLPLLLPSLGVLVALLAVNASVAILRVAVSLRDARPARRSSRSSAGRSRTAVRAPRWPVAYRAATSFFVMVVLIGAAGLSPNAHPQPLVVTGSGGGIGGSGSGSGSGSGGTGVTLTNCSHDNPSISASTLSTLHQLLGPSVILSENPNTGLVVFYDPVNHVTVTEYSLYEDFGYAEFNGDDYAVSGCHP